LRYEQRRSDQQEEGDFFHVADLITRV
jgi:hypothetical protein